MVGSSELGQVKEVHSDKGELFVVLLKGEDFTPPYPGLFGRNLEELETIEKLYQSRRSGLVLPSS